MQEITEKQWLKKTEAERKQWQAYRQKYISREWRDASDVDYDNPFAQWKMEQSIYGITTRRIYRKASSIQQPDLPFRIGRKQQRAVLDANGIEIVIFPVGMEVYAQEFCDYLNAKSTASPIQGEGEKEARLRPYKYFRQHAGDNFDGDVWYNGSIDTVVDLMEGYAAALLSAKDKEIAELKQQLNSK